MKAPLLLSTLVVSLVLGGCFGSEPQAGAKTGAAGAAPATEVGVFTVEHSSVPLTSELKGRTVASGTAEVRPQVGGVIKQRLFEEGSEVKKGQLLYQIDPKLYEAAFNQARANLRSAESTLESARLKDTRYANLVKIEGISKQESDDAHAAYLEAQANIESYKAALETARINLAYTKVVAEIDGRIGISSVTPGALVTADQSTAMATIRSFDPMYVDLTQASRELLNLRKLLARDSVSAGTTDVTLILEDGSEYPLKGQLRARELAVDEATGSVTLRAEFPNPDGLLLPGMFVRAVLSEAVDNQAIVVPQQGVARDNQGNSYALVVGANNQVEKRVVKTERVIGNSWLLSSGLQDGDRLIVEGTSKVNPGSAVNPVAVAVDQDGRIHDIASADDEGAH
ncbi:efflux RND transporter periplasmic adaptor subunit [Parathalassolituus penaei]|uniref:Efflux RND transporter periplasmic adaptor subunit n=1 Tax=Parathalassolituus penaei TaxID=2997323 RepID=A0A9X3ISZ1_9GAMM|nr:efflux RND transporter periplasmic adaptor subunit [Parathalassolituus penaei]MCY0965750.1 efflux RND transporter periplasmic adaptor subunit [Parathalassolituus penaei]